MDEGGQTMSSQKGFIPFPAGEEILPASNLQPLNPDSEAGG
jgi:hypothetical protein